MEMHGNENDPLAKTLKTIKESAQESKLGNAGDFFTPVHPRDSHVKAKNQNNQGLEFNSAILAVNDSSVMQKFIHLKNSIVNGVCMAIGESVNIDKDDGATSIFIQWLQPIGMYEIGTANVTLKGAEVKKKSDPDNATEDIVDDTQSTNKKAKGKGSRKKNTKVKM